MRKKVCVSGALGMTLIVVFFAVSCSKQVAKTQMEPVAAPAPAAESEVKNATPEVRENKDELAELFKEDNLREKEAAARDTAEEAFVNENVHFAFDSFLLSDGAKQILYSKADYLRTNPDITITIEGHCDDRGTEIYNLTLGEQRAESVKEFLVALGIGTDRLNTLSYGEDRPVANGRNEVSWARNRRAQFVIN